MLWFSITLVSIFFPFFLFTVESLFLETRRSKIYQFEKLGVQEIGVQYYPWFNFYFPFLYTVEALFLETKGSKNYRFEKLGSQGIGGKITETLSKENKLWFKKSRGFRKQRFEKLGFHCTHNHTFYEYTKMKENKT